MRGRDQAAFNQAAVSNALLIKGMFMPKLGLVPFFGTALTAGLGAAIVWVNSVARSHASSQGRAKERHQPQLRHEHALDEQRV